MVKIQHHYSRYKRFMDALKGQSVDGYCEVHHIVPRSLGGSAEETKMKMKQSQAYLQWLAEGNTPELADQGAQQ